MKDELLKIFLELLGQWESSKEVIINNRGDVSEYGELEERKKEYIKRFNYILKSI